MGRRVSGYLQCKKRPLAADFKAHTLSSTARATQLCTRSRDWKGWGRSTSLNVDAITVCFSVVHINSIDNISN